MKLRLLATLLLGAVTLTAGAAPGRVIRATELKAKPFSDAVTVMSLAPHTAVEVVTRDGGWYRVKSGKQEGWVHMTALRLGNGTKKGGDSGLGSALGLLQTGRTDSNKVTVATGIRGLDATSITTASPDYQAADDMSRFASSATDARKFAAEAQLKSRHIAYIAAKDSGSK